jgi:hypothetical protein
MAVHVESAISEVVPEAEPQAGAGGGESASWEEVEKLRAAHSRLMMEKSRTRAEGFDD